MKRAIGACVIALLLFSTLSFAEPDVNAVLAELSKAKPADASVWSTAEKIRAMGAGSLEAIKKAAEAKQAVPAKLALGSALLSLQEVDSAVKTLSSVFAVEGENEGKIFAARLIARAQAAGEVALTDLLKNEKDPLVRVELAHSLFTCASSDEAGKIATHALEALLASQQPEVKTAAAFAMAEIDDFRGDIPAILQNLANEPTDRGQLAQKLLAIRAMADVMMKDKDQRAGLGNPILNEVRLRLQQFHVENPPEDEEMVHAAARGLASTVYKTDPFTNYLSPKDWAELREEMSGTYGGVGAHLLQIRTEEGSDKFRTDLRPMHPSPANKAGMKAFDQLIEVEGKSARGLNPDEIKNLLRGKPGTQVKCKVLRKALPEDKVVELTLTREEVVLPSVSYELFPGNIGYIRLTQFGDSSAREFENALVALEKQGMKALVFDLRNNGGGLLTAARSIADKFLGDGKLIVYSEGRNKRVAPRNNLFTTEGGNHREYPVITLINGGSASASEIVSGALQDHKRSIIMGERSYGKGSVQQMMPLASSGGQSILKLTVAKYFLPSGRSIHRTDENRGGVVPDIRVAYEPTWTGDLFERMLSAGDFHNYTLPRWEKEKAKLLELAKFDNSDSSKYPGFDEWYASMKVKTDKDNARLMLRQWIRMIGADELNAEWACDLDEDTQLQRAVFEAAKQLNEDVSKEARYAKFAEKTLRAMATTGAGKDSVKE